LPAFAIIAEKGGQSGEEGNGMVQAENIDSGCSSFQLDDRSRRDHHSLAHFSKSPLSGAGTPPTRLIARAMSALPPKADIAEGDRHVRFVPFPHVRHTYSEVEIVSQRRTTIDV
jgi:hypothetical protein